MIMGRVQTLPTAQHELHRVSPCLCRVDGRRSGGPRLIVFRDPGFFQDLISAASIWSNFRVFRPGLSGDKDSTLCTSITEGGKLARKLSHQASKQDPM